MIRPNHEWIARGVMLLIGLIFVVPTSYKVWCFVDHGLHSQATSAQVVKVGKGMFSRPHLRYVDQRQVSYEFKSEIPFHFFFAPEHGDSLTVFYRIDHPDQVLTWSPMHYVVVPLLFLSVGIYLIRSAFRPALKPGETSGWDQLCRQAGLPKG